jgi:hypothetical protein
MIPEEFMSYVYVGDESMEQNFQHWRQTKKWGRVKLWQCITSK